MMKNLLFVIISALLLLGCSSDSEFSIIYPKEYLPAYPGSWWVYSNGQRSLVHSEYVAHNYEPNIYSPDNSSEKLVPYMDGEYLYEYDITQMSTVFPVKKLLKETLNSDWKVNEVNGEEIWRKTTQKIDSFYLSTDSLYTNVIVVVEYKKTLGDDRWNLKEFYAKNVGLIRVDVNNPSDTLSAVIQKEVVTYHINN